MILIMMMSYMVDDEDPRLRRPVAQGAHIQNGLLLKLLFFLLHLVIGLQNQGVMRTLLTSFNWASLRSPE